MENQKQTVVYIGSENAATANLIGKILDSDMNCEFLDIKSDEREICSKCVQASADLILIDDSGLKKGFVDILKAVLKIAKCGIIILTDKKDPFIEVLALELGADDYIANPEVPELVVVRIRSVLKRCGKNTQIYEEEIRYPGLVVNLSQYKVEINGRRIKMPPKELELLYLLASNPNIVYTREKLLDVIWGYDMDVGSRTVDVHVKRLRDKIEIGSNRWRIGTVWSVGYRFEYNEIDSRADVKTFD